MTGKQVFDTIENTFKGKQINQKIVFGVINQVKNEIVEVVSRKLSNENYFLKKQSIQTTENQRTYKLAPDFGRIHSVVYKDTSGAVELTEIATTSVEYDAAAIEDESQITQRYSNNYVLEGNEITILTNKSIPTSDTNNLIIRYIGYVTDIEETDLNNNTDDLSIKVGLPVACHTTLIDGILSKLAFQYSPSTKDAYYVNALNKYEQSKIDLVGELERPNIKRKQMVNTTSLDIDKIM